MKSIIRITYLLTLLYLLPTSLMAQNQLFSAYQSHRHVHYVCITHTMLESMQRDKQLTIGSYSLQPIVHRIETLLIIRSDHTDGQKQMADDCQRLQRDKRYQTLLLRNIDSVRSLRLYRPEGKYPAEFILYQENTTESIYIVITGHFSADDINRIF